MCVGINEFIENSVRIAIKNSNYFVEEGIKEFEVVSVVLVDDSYNVIKGTEPKRHFKVLALAKHKELANGTNCTAFTVVPNTYTWEMIAMYDGGAIVRDGRICGHNICYGALTEEMATAWLDDVFGTQEVA